MKIRTFLSGKPARLMFSALSLMTVGLGALQMMLEQGEQNDWFSSEFIIYLSCSRRIRADLICLAGIEGGKPGSKSAYFKRS